MNRRGLLVGILSLFVFITRLSFFNNEPTRTRAIPEHGDSQSIVGILARIAQTLNNMDQHLYGQEYFIINSSSKIDNKHSHILFENVDNELNLHLKLLVLISSEISHTDRRNNIRKWWGNKKMWITGYEWKIIFLVGSSTDEKVTGKVQKQQFSKTS